MQFFISKLYPSKWHYPLFPAGHDWSYYPGKMIRCRKGANEVQQCWIMPGRYVANYVSNKNFFNEDLIKSPKHTINHHAASITWLRTNCTVYFDVMPFPCCYLFSLKDNEPFCPPMTKGTKWHNWLFERLDKNFAKTPLTCIPVNFEGVYFMVLLCLWNCFYIYQLDIFTFVYFQVITQIH